MMKYSSKINSQISRMLFVFHFPFLINQFHLDNYDNPLFEILSAIALNIAFCASLFHVYGWQLMKQN